MRKDCSRGLRASELGLGGSEQVTTATAHTRVLARNSVAFVGFSGVSDSSLWEEDLRAIGSGN